MTRMRSIVPAAISAGVLLIAAGGTASAKIEVTGTDAQKQKINDAIQRIKDGSAEGKTCFEALEARAETVTISISDTADIATANGATLEVKMGEDAIDCLKQIDNEDGEGEALDSSSFDLILVHEALGHLLNKLKGMDWGEPEAMAKTNKVRTDLGLPTRTAYVEVEGEGDDRKVTIPFSDGSKVDGTDALKKDEDEGADDEDFARVSLDGQIPVVAFPNPSNNSFDIFIDETVVPPFDPVLLNLVGPDGFPQPVPLELMGMQMLPTPLPEFPTGVSFFEMQIGGFGWVGQPTGPGFIAPFPDNNRGGINTLPLPPLPPFPGDIFTLQMQGDFLMGNSLWAGIQEPGDPEFGFMAINLTGDLVFDDAFGAYRGPIVLRGLGFAPAPPGFFPPCVADVTTTGATIPGQPGYGEPDGVVDLDDLGYFLNAWVAQNAIADVTTSGATIEGQPGFGVPDGVVDLDDLGYFLNFWLTGCP